MTVSTAAIDWYHFLQFPAIDSLFLVSQAVSIISSGTNTVFAYSGMEGF
ncbi:MAG: hypothetical protein M1476_02555 [Candidatus Thermoplasmatota archaeon]|nr:hypothetical protein [Candidatus Thermoplasmatota archaeon]